MSFTNIPPFRAKFVQIWTHIFKSCGSLVVRLYNLRNCECLPHPRSVIIHFYVSSFLLLCMSLHASECYQSSMQICLMLLRNKKKMCCFLPLAGLPVKMTCNPLGVCFCEGCRGFPAKSARWCPIMRILPEKKSDLIRFLDMFLTQREVSASA